MPYSVVWAGLYLHAGLIVYAATHNLDATVAGNAQPFCPELTVCCMHVVVVVSVSCRLPLHAFHDCVL